ncbi:TPA: hypothetical protein ACH3X2_010008 [Trebouxia sp. C0005]
MIEDGQPGHPGLASPKLHSSPSSPSVRSRVKTTELLDVRPPELEGLMAESTGAGLNPWQNGDYRHELQSQKSHVLPVAHIEMSHAVMVHGRCTY